MQDMFYKEFENAEEVCENVSNEEVVQIVKTENGFGVFIELLNYREYEEALQDELIMLSIMLRTQNSGNTPCILNLEEKFSKELLCAYCSITERVCQNYFRNLGKLGFKYKLEDNQVIIEEIAED